MMEKWSNRDDDWWSPVVSSLALMVAASALVWRNLLYNVGDDGSIVDDGHRCIHGWQNQDGSEKMTAKTRTTTTRGSDVSASTSGPLPVVMPTSNGVQAATPNATLPNVKSLRLRPRECRQTDTTRIVTRDDRTSSVQCTHRRRRRQEKQRSTTTTRIRRPEDVAAHETLPSSQTKLSNLALAVTGHESPRPVSAILFIVGRPETWEPSCSTISEIHVVVVVVIKVDDIRIKIWGLPSFGLTTSAAL